MVALILLSFGCLVTVNILWLFLTVPWVGLECVIVVFSDHTHLLYVERLIAFSQRVFINKFNIVLVSDSGMQCWSVSN